TTVIGCTTPTGLTSSVQTISTATADRRSLVECFRSELVTAVGNACRDGSDEAGESDVRIGFGDMGGSRTTLEYVLDPTTLGALMLGAARLLRGVAQVAARLVWEVVGSSPAAPTVIRA